MEREKQNIRGVDFIDGDSDDKGEAGDKEGVKVDDDEELPSFLESVDGDDTIVNDDTYEPNCDSAIKYLYVVTLSDLTMICHSNTDILDMDLEV